MEERACGDVDSQSVLVGSEGRDDDLEGEVDEDLTQVEVGMDGVQARPYALAVPPAGNLALPTGELSEPSIPSLRKIINTYDDRKPQRRDPTSSLQQSGTDNIAKFNVYGNMPNFYTLTSN